MGKNCLKQILTYINKVYDVGEKINSSKNKNSSPVKNSTISFIILFGFMLQIRSINRLKRLLKKNKFKNLLPNKKTKTPLVDAVRRSLSDFDLNGLKDFHSHIVKTTIENKVFRNGSKHYFHTSIVCATVGSDPHIIIG